LRLSDEVATHVSTELDGGGDGDNDPEETSPSSFRALPKLARRRAVREALSELPLPELTAILLRNVDGFRLSEMAGLVAQTESQVQATLASAKSLIMRKLRSNVSEP
jgi:DNA-directed RNA polymerase specialized sigma24 family protein